MDIFRGHPEKSPTFRVSLTTGHHGESYIFRPSNLTTPLRRTKKLEYTVEQIAKQKQYNLQEGQVNGGGRYQAGLVMADLVMNQALLQEVLCQRMMNRQCLNARTKVKT